MSRSTKDNIEDALSEIQRREDAFKKALEDDAVAEHTAKLEKAKAFLSAQGTEKAREAQAVVDSEKFMLDQLKKRAVKEFTREALKDAQDALSARQTLLKFEVQTNFGSMGAGA